jgi:hypothetical protein
LRGWPTPGLEICILTGITGYGPTRLRQLRLTVRIMLSLLGSLQMQTAVWELVTLISCQLLQRKTTSLPSDPDGDHVEYLEKRHGINVKLIYSDNELFTKTCQWLESTGALSTKDAAIKWTCSALRGCV